MDALDHPPSEASRHETRLYLRAILLLADVLLAGCVGVDVFVILNR